MLSQSLHCHPALTPSRWVLEVPSRTIHRPDGPAACNADTVRAADPPYDNRSLPPSERVSHKLRSACCTRLCEQGSLRWQREVREPPHGLAPPPSVSSRFRPRRPRPSLCARHHARSPPEARPCSSLPSCRTVRRIASPPPNTPE